MNHFILGLYFRKLEKGTLSLSITKKKNDSLSGDRDTQIFDNSPLSFVDARLYTI